MKSLAGGVVVVVASLLVSSSCSYEEEASQPAAPSYQVARPSADQQKIIDSVKRETNAAKREGDRFDLIVGKLCYYGQRPGYGLVNIELPELYDEMKTGLWPKTARDAMAKECPDALAG